MTTIGDAVNLRDYAANHVGDKVGTVAEVIAETNAWAENIPWVEANERLHHVTIERLTQPTASARQINAGTSASKGAERQIVETVALFESRSHIDRVLVEGAADPGKFRFNKDIAHINGISEAVADVVAYGNQTTTPEHFNGLITRYATPSATLHTRGFQIIDGGGTGSTNTSILLVGWGTNACYGIYPKGSQMGIDMMDRGLQTIDKTDGTRWDAYETVVRWDCGLAIEDYGYAVRVANIDYSLLTKSGSSGADLVDLMDRAVSRLKTGMAVKPNFLVNRWIYSFLMRQCSNRSNTQLSIDSYEKEGGRRVLSYQGIPIRLMDALLNSEAAVSGTFATL